MIDFHCHLDLYPNPREMTNSIVTRNMYLLSITTTPSAWTGTVALTHNQPRIWTALGLHPQIAHERKGELPLFEQFLSDTQYVGEIGLDGSPEFKRHWADQQIVLDHILQLCKKAGGRIMSLHSRRATTEVLDAIEKYDGAGTPILHWFSGTQRELRRAIKLGCWFSVGPAMLVGNKGHEIASQLPRDRVLTESDGPFAQVDQRPALPWDVARAEFLLGKIWSEPASVIKHRLVSNIHRLTGLQF